jgi:hypothetical protein
MMPFIYRKRKEFQAKWKPETHHRQNQMQYVKKPLIKNGQMRPIQAKCSGAETFFRTMQFGITIANIRKTSTTLSNILTATNRLEAVLFIVS